MFSKNGGNLGEQGSVAWMFERKSQIIIDAEKAPGEDELMALVLDAGADDLREEDGSWEVLSAPEVHVQVLEAIQKAGIPTESAEIAMIPKNLMKLEGKTASGMMKLSEAARRTRRRAERVFQLRRRRKGPGGSGVSSSPAQFNAGAGHRLRNGAHRLGRDRERRAPARGDRARGHFSFAARSRCATGWRRWESRCVCCWCNMLRRRRRWRKFSTRRT